MGKKTLQGRLKSVRRGMSKKGIDCMVITACENICYLSGFTGHDSWLIVTSRSITLVTDSRYTEQAVSECFGCRIFERTGLISKAAAKIIAKSKSIKTVGIEDSTSVAVFKTLKKELDVRLKSVGGIVEIPRRAKDAAEVKAVCKAAKIAYDALFETLSCLEAGISESDLAGRLEFEMRKQQATPFFETIVCFGANGSRNHHQPGSRKLRKNDAILIDFGAKYKSYGCDITRCFAIGAPTALYEKVYFIVKAAQQAAIKAIKPGVKLSAIDKIARDVIEYAGLEPFKHGTGHGLGLFVHEIPNMAKKSKGTLMPGDIVTVEPGIYMQGKLGVRIEDDILVTETGHKILTVDKKYGFSEPDMPVIDIC
jgi:Xaa-Pro aminopeptidase